MKKHTKIYLDAFNYTIADWIKCEIPACGKKAIDIHHIENRKAGGDPNGEKDKIENIMALCRECHLKIRRRTKSKTMAERNTFRKSKYIGVLWNVRANRWRVQFTYKGEAHYAGVFKYEDERKAALAYDRKAAALGITKLNILKPKI